MRLKRLSVHHADLLEASFWQAHKDRILAGHVHDVFPYDKASLLFKAMLIPFFALRWNVHVAHSLDSER
jgi:hypothetical protein